MGKFWSTGRIRTAVNRLSDAGVQTRLQDFLIFKRAWALSKESQPGADPNQLQVVTGTRSPDFVLAINEWTARTADFDSLPGLDNPYFVPFAANRDTTNGYRTKKYTSNGPSDTVARWQATQIKPFVLVPDTKPKAFRFAPLSREELTSFFVLSTVQQGGAELPRLLDAAVWWYRFADLEQLFGSDIEMTTVVDAFVKECQLNAVEVSTLFSDDRSDTTADMSEDSEPEFADHLADASLYLPTATHTATAPPSASSAAHVEPDLDDIERLASYIAGQGFTFEPWQLATYVSAVRTKPFVILAGISGTGKTKLPRLVADATDAVCETVPVRPDWHDSSELLGYVALDGTFQPGHLLRFARQAMDNPDRQYFFVLDEMNIARVEYYLAEVLSRIEERVQGVNGAIETVPFFPHLTGDSAKEWTTVFLPGNLCIVGSVNMDETTFGFSKKVLDRAFVIEFSTVDLSSIGSTDVEQLTTERWPSQKWQPAALRLSNHPDRENPEVNRVITALSSVNEALTAAQLQVGYRVRDEVAMFCLAAEKCPEQFATTESGTVDPLDVAIAMKVLPRIQGSGPAIRSVLDSLLLWAAPDAPAHEGSFGTGRFTGFPFCEKRLKLMQSRLKESGFANFWI